LVFFIMDCGDVFWKRRLFVLFYYGLWWRILEMWATGALYYELVVMLF
jgi:hypothetical protein